VAGGSVTVVVKSREKTKEGGNACSPLGLLRRMVHSHHNEGRHKVRGSQRWWKRGAWLVLNPSGERENGQNIIIFVLKNNNQMAW
jgi:hypothetical protein